MKDFIICKIIAEYHLCFKYKKTIYVNPSYSGTMKNEGKDFKSFGNITECLKT